MNILPLKKTFCNYIDGHSEAVSYAIAKKIEEENQE
jgi:hypothetical protein